jgi:hypothetical protein
MSGGQRLAGPPLKLFSSTACGVLESVRAIVVLLVASRLGVLHLHLWKH